MIPEPPYEIAHLPPRLHSEFDGLVPPAKSGRSEQEKEVNFLSRSLAAFAIHKLAGCPREQAAAAVVDAGQDGGIDAVYHAPMSNTLWLVQSKFFSDGLGEPALGDVSKFRDGIENLSIGNWAAFERNEHWRTMLPAVRRHLDDPSLRNYLRTTRLRGSY